MVKPSAIGLDRQLIHKFLSNNSRSGFRRTDKTFLLSGTAAILLCVSTESSAQSISSVIVPKVSFQDKNGVDLSNGVLIADLGKVEIGPKDSPVLSRDILPSYQDGDRTPRDGWLRRDRVCNAGPGGYCTGNWEPTVHVRVGASSFDAYVDGSCNGECAGEYKIVEGADKWTLYDHSGKKWIFDRNYVIDQNASATNQSATVGKLLSIEESDGQTLTYNYDGVYVRSITSNLGYQINFQDVNNLVPAFQITNLAYQYCDKLASTCPNNSYNWPKITYLSTSSTEVIVSDALARKYTLATSSDGSQTRTTPGGVSRKVTRRSLYAGGPLVVVSKIEDPLGETLYDFTVTQNLFGSLVAYKVLRGTATSPSKSSVSFSFDDAAISSANNQFTTPGKPYKSIITNELNQKTIYEFFQERSSLSELWLANDRIKKVTSPESLAIEVAYDGRRRPISSITYEKPSFGSDSMTTLASYQTCSDWAKCSNPTQVLDARGNAINYEYDDVTGLIKTKTEQADANGVRKKTSYTFQQLQAVYKNASGQSVPSGSPVWRLVSSSTCQTKSICAGTSDEIITNISYNDNLLPTVETISTGDGVLVSTTTKKYDAIGNVVAVDGPLPGAGDTTRYFYDAGRELTGEIAPAPGGGTSLPYPSKRYTYNLDGQVTLVERGYATAQTETALTAMTVTEQVATAYDNAGRKISERKSAGGVVFSVTHFSYDLDSRLICTAVRMDKGQWDSQSDACVPQTTGPNGPDRITKNVYDAAGRLIQVRQAVGVKPEDVGAGRASEQAYATYSYTLDGKQEYVIDANGNRAQFAYDGFNRLWRWYFPSSSLPAAFNGSNQTTALSSAGSINSIDYEEYGYDPNGNRTSLRKRDGRTFAYTYDALNRVIKKQVPKACVSGYVCTTPPADTVRDVYYGYDLQGHQLYARFDSDTGEGITNEFDGLGRQISTKNDMDGTARKLSFQYDAAGNRTQVTFPDAQCFNYTYDALNRLRDIYQDGVYQSGICQTGSGVKTVSLDWNAQGQLQQHKRGAVTTTYEYDAISRLHSLSDALPNAGQSVTLGFTYNAANQIIQRDRSNDAYRFNGYANADRAYTPNGLNQYAQVGTNPNKYDSNGNLIEDGDFNTGANRYGYDAENRLVTSELKSSSTIALRYDPLGRLFKISGGSAGTTQFLYDGDQLVAEYAGNGALLRRYVHGPGEDDPLLWYEGAGLGDRRSLQIDQQGSIVSVASASGTASIYSYDEYGNPNSGQAGRFQYTGQAWIPELGLYYYKARMYAPKIGRFLQTDPIGYKDQINLYAYVTNDPVNLKDPTGEIITVTGSPETRAILKQAMYNIARSNPELARRFHEMINSKNTHDVRFYHASDGRSENRSAPIYSSNGIGSGSISSIDDHYLSADGKSVKDQKELESAIVHELLGHGYNADHGKKKTEVVGREKSGRVVRGDEITATMIENTYRDSAGLKPHDKYGNVPIPRY